MFERFSDRARRSVILAQEIARMQASDRITPEHLLAGLIDEGEGMAYVILNVLVEDLERFRSEVLPGAFPSAQEGGSPTRMPFTPRLKKCLELALREALQLGHSYIGTEHLLLAILREGDSDAARFLEGLDVNAKSIREQLVTRVPGERADEPELLEDPDGAPYPEEVQRLVKNLSEIAGVPVERLRRDLVEALESVAKVVDQRARYDVAHDAKAYLTLLEGRTTPR